MPEALQPGGDQAVGGVGLAQVPGPLDHLDLCPTGGQFLDQFGLGVAEHQVVAPLGHEPGQRRADVEAGIRDQGDAAVGVGQVVTSMVGRCRTTAG